MSSKIKDYRDIRHRDNKSYMVKNDRNDDDSENDTDQRQHILMESLVDLGFNKGYRRNPNLLPLPGQNQKQSGNSRNAFSDDEEINVEFDESDSPDSKHYRHKSHPVRSDTDSSDCDENIKKPTESRIEFVRNILNGNKLKPMIDFDNNETESFSSAKINKKVLDVKELFVSMDVKLKYIKSGTTGHTFKATCKKDKINSVCRQSVCVSY